MKKLLTVILTLIFTNVFCQGIDTVINAGIYKSYYDIDIKQPIYLSYKLYKGGGKCSREGFRFKNDTKIPTATDKDYAGSGFDMGHLANAADFANDCQKDELTFRFYNCLPQYPNLNRGIWKRCETQIRQESQSDSLLIICGGVFSEGSKRIGTGVWVPDYCWKVVISLTTNKPLHVWWFANVSKESDKFFMNLSLQELESKIGYKIPLKY